MRTIDRETAINEIRAKLLSLADDEHSICEVAARYHIFCGGFARWSFLELKKRNAQIVRTRPHITPQELRELADRWQITRQMLTGEALACDVQVQEKSNKLCRGWNEFDDEQLAAYHLALCGDEIAIAPRDASGPSGKGS